MVKSQEVTRWLLREISADAVLMLYKETLKHGDMLIRMNARSIAKHIAYEMIEDGKSEREAKEFLRNEGFNGSSPEKATGTTLNAIRLFGDARAALKMCSGTPFQVNITRRIVERVVIEKMIETGFDNAKIVAMTGFGIRRVQRIRKQMREEEND